MTYELICYSEIEYKLRSVKAIKQATNLGLKESKEIIDYLSEKGLRRRYVNMPDINQTIQEELRECGIYFEDRETKIDDVLVEFIVNFWGANYIYKVFEGSYTIEDNVLTIEIIDGKVINQNDNCHYEDRERELKNRKVKLDFRQSIIDELC